MNGDRDAQTKDGHRYESPRVRSFSLSRGRRSGTRLEGRLRIDLLKDLLDQRETEDASHDDDDSLNRVITTEFRERVENDQ